MVGIVKKYDFIDLKNKLGNTQTQARFIKTDGRYHYSFHNEILISDLKNEIINISYNSCNVKVIFWDKYGENFNKAITKQLGKPALVIIAGCKAGLWNGILLK